MITESCLSFSDSLWLLKDATISHAIAIAPEIYQSVGIRKKTASIPNISQPNCRGMTTLEPICRSIFTLKRNLRIVRLSKSYALFISFVNSQGEREMPESYYFTLPSTPTFKILSVYRLEKVASSGVQDSDLLGAKDVGEDVYKAFREQRVECDSSNVKFHDIMEKAKLKTFTDLKKKTKVKASNNQEVVLNAEKRLFAQMIVIAVCRNLQMSEVIAHPLGPLTSMHTG